VNNNPIPPLSGRRPQQQQQQQRRILLATYLFADDDNDKGNSRHTNTSPWSLFWLLLLFSNNDKTTGRHANPAILAFVSCQRRGHIRCRRGQCSFLIVVTPLISEHHIPFLFSGTIFINLAAPPSQCFADLFHHYDWWRKTVDHDIFVGQRREILCGTVS
jgi:hypothetical protein